MTPEQKQAALEKLADDIIKQANDLGLKDILHAQFMDTLERPTTQNLTLDEIIERYGDVLSPEQLDKLKEYIYGKK